MAKARCDKIKARQQQGSTTTSGRAATTVGRHNTSRARLQQAGGTATGGRDAHRELGPAVLHKHAVQVVGQGLRPSLSQRAMDAGARAGRLLDQAEVLQLPRVPLGALADFGVPLRALAPGGGGDQRGGAVCGRAFLVDRERMRLPLQDTTALFLRALLWGAGVRAVETPRGVRLVLQQSSL